jgi:hypothetical protein
VHDDYSDDRQRVLRLPLLGAHLQDDRAFDEAKLLEQMPYKKVMRIMARRRCSPTRRGWQ